MTAASTPTRRLIISFVAIVLALCALLTLLGRTESIDKVIAVSSFIASLLPAYASRDSSPRLRGGKKANRFSDTPLSTLPFAVWFYAGAGGGAVAGTWSMFLYYAYLRLMMPTIDSMNLAAILAPIVIYAIIAGVTLVVLTSLFLKKLS